MKGLGGAAKRVVVRDLREGLDLTEIQGRTTSQLLTLPIGGMNRIRAAQMVVKGGELGERELATAKK